MQPFCLDCGSDQELTLDHTPAAWQKLAEGARLTIRDVAVGLLDVRCQPCNQGRGAARGANVARHD